VEGVLSEALSQGINSVGLVRQPTDDRVEVTGSNPVCPTKITPMFYTYVLYSHKFNKIYIGFSGDAYKRLAAHNDERNRGWTKRYQPWEIIHLESFETKTEALKREKELKSSRGRSFVRSLIAGH